VNGGQHFAKAYGIKVRCYGEHVGGTHWGNWGTNGEPGGNMMRTHWEQGRQTKINSPHPTS